MPSTDVDAVLDGLNARIDGIQSWMNAQPQGIMNRVVGAALALPTSTVIAVAMWLTPSEKGYGTHLQLGLGECISMALTGWPCPMCGMTTTFTHMAHGNLVQAFFTQPFGVVLFSVTVLVALLGWIDVVFAPGLYKRALGWISRREQVIAAGLLVGLLGGWIYKAVVMHPGTFGLG
jgi:hypothetical protein